MKTILLASLLSLLCVGWAEAGEYMHTVVCGTHTDPDIKCTGIGTDTMGVLNLTQAELDAMQRKAKEQYGEEDYLRVMLIDPPCLGKMEAAMRAIKPFLFSSYTDNQSQAWRDDWARQRDKAIWLFLDVERNCWQSGR